MSAINYHSFYRFVEDIPRIEKSFENIQEAISLLPGINPKSVSGSFSIMEGRCLILFESDGTRSDGLAFLGKLISRRYHNGDGRGWKLELSEVCDTTGEAVFYLKAPAYCWKDLNEMADTIRSALKHRTWPLNSVQGEDFVILFHL